MLTRREILKTLALSSGAASLPLSHSFAQAPAAPTAPTAPTAPAAPTTAPTPPAAAPSEVHKLPALGYDYDALEPFLDAETMKLHHDKHHATYVAKLNQALEKEPSLKTRSIEDLLKNLSSLPESLQTEIRNQGGGHYNHSLLWKSLRKKDGDAPDSALLKALQTAFGSREGFEEKIQAAALKVFGSGWAWLTLKEGKLQIESTPNQDCPLTTGSFPILGIDVWEHAYYLKYQNLRAEYLKAFLKVIHWEFVSHRFQEALAAKV
jgi:Fe-Mn family superoxide dismutase